MSTMYVKCYIGKTKFHFRNQMLLSDFKYKYDQKWEQNCALGCPVVIADIPNPTERHVSFLMH